MKFGNMKHPKILNSQTPEIQNFCVRCETVCTKTEQKLWIEDFGSWGVKELGSCGVAEFQSCGVTELGSSDLHILNVAHPFRSPCQHDPA